MNASLNATVKASSNVSMRTSRGRLTFARPSLAAALAGSCIAFIACAAHAQQVANPGDIVLEREVAPRNAFVSVPNNQEPILSSATTFPANSFNPAMAQLASDSDLTHARGSTGLSSPGVLAGTGMQAVTRILSGNTTGNNVALGAGGIGQPAASIGGTISSSVTGALAPLSSAPGGALGGLK
ncbi:hypothetical protein QYH69_32025 [Paraburkholderia sp. SARCC-3016]|uniref:hypothetical protein n=1 Tax=Paraburkholderia sp. SARCC-3016 TaxID=3058611 RepID=UPI0028082D36|nr:hypothetical protein [Paraburkholderia sp. SARCC-3016]MDQ7981851.1 hypothetical protein [Paraburkholderia sp. SARCC-3016]